MRGNSARDKGVRSGKGFKIVQGEDGSGMRRLPPQSPIGLDKGNKRRNRETLGEGESKLKMAATSMYDVLLDTEECHE